MSNKIEKFNYIDYLNEFNKNNIAKVWDVYDIAYKKNLKKETLVELLNNNLEKIVTDTFNLFRKSEYKYTEKIIKKRGHIKVKRNKLFLTFCNFLNDLYLLKQTSLSEYVMPNDVYLLFKQKLKSKRLKETVKLNDYESDLILGYIDAYGVIDFDYFYSEYSKKYKYQKKDAIERIASWQRLYGQFKFIDNKYICSNLIRNIRDAEKYINLKDKYAVYTNEEIVKIHKYEYLAKSKEYKRLIKYITKLYDVNKDGIKIINKYILNPYNQYYQYDKKTSKSKLDSLLSEFFEPYKDKYKEKLVEYLNNFIKICPNWNYKGNIRKDKDEK